CAGSALDLTLGMLRRHGWEAAPMLLTATILFAFAYFVVNTLLVTLVPKLKRNERLTLAELFGNFGWIGIAYAGSASVATLLFHSAFTHAFIGMTLLGADGRILQANRAWRGLLGLGDEELATHAFSDFVCPDDVGDLDEQLAAVAAGRASSFSTQLRCRHRDG